MIYFYLVGLLVYFYFLNKTQKKKQIWFIYRFNYPLLFLYENPGIPQHWINDEIN